MTSRFFNFVPRHTSAAQTSASGCGGFTHESTEVRCIRWYYRQPHRARHIASERIVENFRKLVKDVPKLMDTRQKLIITIVSQSSSRTNGAVIWKASYEKVSKGANTWLLDLSNYRKICIERSPETFCAGQSAPGNLDFQKIIHISNMAHPRKIGCRRWLSSLFVNLFISPKLL